MKIVSSDDDTESIHITNDPIYQDEKERELAEAKTYQETHARKLIGEVDKPKIKEESPDPLLVLAKQLSQLHLQLDYVSNEIKELKSNQSPLYSSQPNQSQQVRNPSRPRLRINELPNRQ